MRLMPAVLALFTLVACGCSPQNKLVYHPKSYPFSLSELPAQTHAIAFETRQGAQQAFYVPPRSAKLGMLWVFFPGNASVALDWLDWTGRYPDADAGFLLIDYPGYGFSEGSPSADAILEVSESAYARLAQSLHADPAQLWHKTSVLGHSLGAATALQFAARHTPQRVVLVAPFTTLRDIGRHVLGGWVGPLIHNEYDNIHRVQELESRQVAVYVVHGSADDVIPVAFGRELGKKFSWVQYREVPGARHTNVFELGRDTILRCMGQEPPALARRPQ